MRVNDWLEVAAAENLASDPASAAVIGRFWWNTAEGRLKCSDGTLSRAMLRNDAKLVIGNNATANNNIRLHRGASSVLQFLQGGDATAEGSLSVNLAQISSRIESYTTAARPAASVGNSGRIIYDSDLDKLLMNTDSGAWEQIGDVGLTASQTLTNKTLTSPTITTPTTDILNLDDQGSNPASPSAGYIKVFGKTDGKIYKMTSDGTVTELGAGAGGINYIGVGDAETNSVAAFVGYDDSNLPRPVDGTGGSATGLTLATSSSNPLRGTYSFTLAKAASNSRGQGQSIDFTIHRQDRNKVLVIETEVELASGTYAGGTSSTDSDLIVYIYDITNGVLIEPTGFKIDPGVLGNNAKIISTFQTTSSTSYRLIYHVATVSASAWTLKFEVKVGPQTVQYGAPITDPALYTPTFVGMGTVTAIETSYHRVGSRLLISGNFTTGVATAVQATMSLPAGLSIADATKIPSIKIVGFADADEATASSNKKLTLLATPSATSFQFAFDGGSGSYSPLSPQNGNIVFFNSTKYSFFLAVEILGWGSSVQMSNDTDTRVVAAKQKLVTGYTPAANAVIAFDSVTYDTHGAVSGGRFTAPIPGTFSVSGTIHATTGANLQLYKNGVFHEFLATYAASAITAFSTEIKLVAGDIIDVRPDVGTTALNNDNTTLSISKVSGPSAIAASEAISAQYGLTSNFVATVGNPIKLDTKIEDTHGSYSTATGLFTCAVAGRFRLSFTGLTTAGGMNPQLVKNGTARMYLGQVSAIAYGGGSHTISCVAGDTIGAYADNNVTLVGSAAPYQCFLSIEKVG